MLLIFLLIFYISIKELIVQISYSRILISKISFFDQYLQVKISNKFFYEETTRKDKIRIELSNYPLTYNKLTSHTLLIIFQTG